MNFWIITIVHVICTCTATKILYVLPDNVSDVNCPSQPCATLGQYLLDNGSLPVLSDVEYYFLPGEHHVVNAINLLNVVNFSLIGFGLTTAKLICLSESYVGIFFSNNVTIRYLMFEQCNGDLSYQLNLDIVAGLLLYECSYCKVEGVHFSGFGIVGKNLLRNSHLSSITINMTIVRPAIQMCSPKVLLIFQRDKNDPTLDSISINQLSITGYSEMCYELHGAMEIRLYQSYGMHIKLLNSQFYIMDQIPLIIQMNHTDGSLSQLVKNCTFGCIKHKSRNVLIPYVVYGKIANVNVTIKFQDCIFYKNVAQTLLEMELTFYNGLCVHQTNVTIENCEFVDNYGGGSLVFCNDNPSCKANVLLNGAISFIKNTAHFIMYFSDVAVYMNGTTDVLENNVTLDIVKFEDCTVMFSNSVTFISNICTNVILMESFPLPYIILTEFVNITFTKNAYRQLLVASGPIINNYDNIFPYCIFQYKMISTNDPSNITELLTLYAINLNGNKKIEHDTTFNFAVEVESFNNFLTHCKWLPMAVFNGHKPEYINKQIIQVDGHQWVHHKQICYCPHDGVFNCTVDLLGPVYPGKMLQVDLCIPQADRNHTVYTVTHGPSLPNSTCHITYKTDLLVISISNHSETINFSIVSENKICTLFLIARPFIRSAFYVEILPCPVGFTLQNGKCDCDPFLPPDIETCYIDLSAIRRPANTWITAHTITNNITNYLISDCPMVYCLPYSTNINLAHPDLQCQFNRTGILCSQCQHPLSMVFASSRCMKCTNVHILITIIVIVAGIILVALLYVLNLTVTIGTINGIIFYANIVSINDSVFLVNDNVFKPLRVFISFINLDLGIETCFYNGMDSYAKMWLQLLFPSYLIIIAISIIIASCYSTRILRLTYSRSLPVLATLFLLSYAGVLRVVLTVLFLYSTITVYPSGDKQIVWSIDASVPLFGIKFTILFIACILLFILLILLCTALLFTKLLSQFRAINHFKPLLDAFQGSYKEKYCFWTAVNLIFRNLFFTLYTFQGKLRLFIATAILVLFIASYGYVCPSKNKAVNIQNLSLLVNLTIMFAIPLLNNKEIFFIGTNLLISLALVQFCIIFLYHCLTYTFHCNVIIKEKLLKVFTAKKQ